MTVDERFQEIQLTEAEQEAQQVLMDFITNSMVGVHNELLASGADTQKAAGMTINAVVRGVMVFANGLYGINLQDGDHEGHANARKQAAEFVHRTVVHTTEQAAEYFKGKLN